MSEGKPFSSNGESNGDQTEPFSASPAAPVALGATSGGEDAQAAADAANPQGGLPAGELRCRCGAPAHATEIDICARGHALPGNRRTLTHGLYSERPADADAEARAEAVDAAGDAWWRYDWECEMYVEIGDRLSDLLDSMRPRTRALSVANMKLGMGLLREMSQVGADIEASKPARPRVSDSEQLERAARVALRHADAFIAMFTEALALDPKLAPLLRAALDAHDAKLQPAPEHAEALPTREAADGVPRPVADDDDEVLL